MFISFSAFDPYEKNIYKLKSHYEIKDKLNLLIVGGSQGANIFDKDLKNSNLTNQKYIKFLAKVIEQ